MHSSVSLLLSRRSLHTRMNLTLALLCSLGWISVSVSEFLTVEVQPGEDVQLLCPNLTSVPAHMFWFKVSNTSDTKCISKMLSSAENASSCDGFNSSKFLMTSNTSTLFLTIKQVDPSDSGLYFCQQYLSDKTSATYTYLKVDGASVHPGAECHVRTNLAIVASAALIFVLIVTVPLVLRIRKLQSALQEKQEPQDLENSDSLNYAALNFRQKPKRGRRSPEPPEPEVVYAATR